MTITCEPCDLTAKKTAKKQYQREWYLANRERILDKWQTTHKHKAQKKYAERTPEETEAAKLRFREWRAANPEKAKNSVIKSTYGITLGERDALFASQGYVCAICKTDDPGSRAWHIDHCHETLVVRGVLCQHCNSLLGFARDNTGVLAKAIEYLEKDFEAQEWRMPNVAIH